MPSIAPNVERSGPKQPTSAENVGESSDAGKLAGQKCFHLDPSLAKAGDSIIHCHSTMLCLAAVSYSRKETEKKERPVFRGVGVHFHIPFLRFCCLIRHSIPHSVLLLPDFGLCFELKRPAG